ncbi:MAG: hypothetical protein ACK5V1_03440, partial [Planctomycetaceae bacterium]
MPADRAPTRPPIVGSRRTCGHHGSARVWLPSSPATSLTARVGLCVCLWLGMATGLGAQESGALLLDPASAGFDPRV